MNTARAFGSEKKKLLVLTPPPAQQFVKNDVRILSRFYQVTLFEGLRGHNLLKFIASTNECDFILCWFGCRAAAIAVLLAKLLGKKIAIIAGGQDVAWLPEIDHGMMGKPWHRTFIRFAFNHCDAALAVSAFTAGELLRWAQPQCLCLVYNGVDVPAEESTIRAGVICIARVTEVTFRLKGIASLIEAARLLPEVPFTLVGEISESMQFFLVPLIPGNLKLTGRLEPGAVQALCRSSAVCVQPSYYESFGVGLAEAMACGCTPVVTDRGALPEVVSGTGYYAKYGDGLGLAHAIVQGLATPSGGSAKERISACFTLARRGDSLKRVIEALLCGNGFPRDLLFSARAPSSRNDSR